MKSYLLLPVISLTLSCSTFRNPSQECVHDANNLRCVSFLRAIDAKSFTVRVHGESSLFGKMVKVNIKGIVSPDLKSSTLCEREKALKARKIIKRTLKRASRIDLLNIRKTGNLSIFADVLADSVYLKKIIFKKKLGRPADIYTREMPWCIDQAKQSTVPEGFPGKRKIIMQKLNSDGTTATERIDCGTGRCKLSTDKKTGWHYCTCIGKEGRAELDCCR